MVLTVPFEDFPNAAKRFDIREVYVSERNSGTLISALDKRAGCIVASHTDLNVSEVKQQLEGRGFSISQGRWGQHETALEEGSSHQAYVAAVSYESRDTVPGLWMDAFPTIPTPQIVLRTMYDEFKKNSELGDVTYEEFLHSAHPNVVILSPGEIATFLAQKEEC